MHDITYHTFIHENVRKRFMEGFHHDAHPMGMLVSTVAALSTFYPEAKDIDDPRGPQQADRPPHRQDADARRRRPPLQRRACRSSTPTTRLDFPSNFLSMMWKIAEPRYEADPVLARALDVLFILHADHEQNCSHHRHAGRRLVPRRPVLGHRRGRRRPLRPPPRRRQRGRHPHAHRDRLASTTSTPSSPRVKEGKGRLQGFGHRVYKNYDPRATIIKQTADEVFEVTGKNPLLDIALKLEEVALADDYFISRKLYPNVDFYSGLIYQAMGFPIEMFTGAVRHPPHRRAGWPTGRSCSSRTRRSPGPASSTPAPAPATTSTDRSPLSRRPTATVDDDLAHVGVGLQVPVGLGDLGQRVAPVDHRPDRPASKAGHAPGPRSDGWPRSSPRAAGPAAPCRRGGPASPAATSRSMSALPPPITPTCTMRPPVRSEARCCGRGSRRRSRRARRRRPDRRWPRHGLDEVVVAVVDDHVGAERLDRRRPWPTRRSRPRGRPSPWRSGRPPFPRRRRRRARGPSRPRSSPPCTTSASQAVMNTSGMAAASATGTPAGTGHQLPLVDRDPLGVGAAADDAHDLVADDPAGHPLADGPPPGRRAPCRGSRAPTGPGSG